MDTRRRQALQTIVHLTGTAAFVSSASLMPVDALDRLFRALAKSSDIDQITLDYLAGITLYQRQHFVFFEGADWHELFYDVFGHLNLLTRLLTLSHSSSTHAILCTLAGETALLLGDILFNAGDNTAADSYYHSALEAARNANHDLLQAVILARMSFVALYGQYPPHALPLLDEAQRLAGPHCADIISSWLWAIKAETYASTQHLDLCYHALEKSEALLHRSLPGNIPYAFRDEISYALMSPLKLLSYKGVCYLHLLRPAATQSVLQAYLSRLDSGSCIPSFHQKSIVLVDLGKSCIQQADVKDACTYISQALQCISLTKSFRVFERAWKVRAALAPWNHTSHVKHLDEEFMAFIPSLS